MSPTNLAPVLASMSLAGTLLAASTTPDDAVSARLAELERGMQALRAENSQLKSELSEVKTQNGDKWLTEQRASEIRSVVQDVLGDASTRTSLQAAQTTGGWDKGFFLASPDGNFKLKIGGQIQTRWAGNFYSNRDDDILNERPREGVNRGTTSQPVGSYKKTSTGFEIRRMKIDFSGHVVDPSWQYRVVMIYSGQSGAANNPGGPGATGSTAGLEDVYVRKDLGNGMAVQMGQFKSPFLREELVSSKYQLAAERSLVNQMFSTKFTQGLMGEWRGDNLLVQGCYNDGGNNASVGAAADTQNTTVGATPATTFNNGVGFTEWAFTSRVAWLAFGNWKQFDDMSSFRGEDAGFLLGLNMNWQRGGQQSNGAYIASNNLPLDGNSDAIFLTWSVDASWDLGGANLYSAFVMNTAYGIPQGANGDASINSYGLVVQGGYFITDEVELYGRWEWMSTQNQGYNNLPTPAGVGVGTANVFNAGRVNVATLGGNWYVNGNRNLKFTVDYGWTFSGALWFNNGIFNQGVSGADYRIEPDGGGNETVVRAQLQLLF